ncbi:kinesin-domain-containing protein, partial [Atractiella rhizophila]
LYESRISAVVKAAMEGFNGTVFAYGQTASGKTHTMMGTEDQPGIIPLAVTEIFDLISSSPSREFLIRVSFLEIYKENLRDLLQMSPSSQVELPQLKIHEDKKGRIYVGNLKEEIVLHHGQVMDILRRGGDERKVGETEWNERSSRSHAVFTMTIESHGKESGDEEVRKSQLNLIDLAGSERAAAAEERRKEGAFINKSLLALGTVIAKLTEGKGTTHVPFRDSKLTRLLQTSLSGNARVAIVCAISPEFQHGVETLSTLKFAQRAKMIVTNAERGIIMQEKTLIQKYMAEIEALKEQL